jgi:hypothetical protein
MDRLPPAQQRGLQPARAARHDPQHVLRPPGKNPGPAAGRGQYLVSGDSHLYNVDAPLAAGSSWLPFYGITGTADNLTRITVNGSSLGESDWLKLTTHSVGAPLTWQLIPAT